MNTRLKATFGEYSNCFWEIVAAKQAQEKPKMPKKPRRPKTCPKRPKTANGTLSGAPSEFHEFIGKRSSMFFDYYLVCCKDLKMQIPISG